MMNSLRTILFALLFIAPGISPMAVAAPRLCPRIHAEDGGLFERPMAFKVGPGRNMFFRRFHGDPNKPTLVVLPWIIHAFPAAHIVLKRLADEGYNLIITATSSHWESLPALGKNEAAFHDKQNPTAKDFLQETNALLKELKVKKPILMAMSYGALIAGDSNLPKIYIAPLVRQSESNPQGARAAAQWESVLAMNPFMGNSAIRQFRDSNYRKLFDAYVAKELDADVNYYNGNTNKQQIAESYVSISRATEGFDLSKTDFSGKNERIFIVAENEIKSRLRGQIESVAKAVEQGPTRLILVRHSEHNIAESQPDGLSISLVEALTQKNTQNLKVGIVDTKKSKKIRWLKGDEQENLFREILGLEESIEPADLSSVLGK